jgi:hypothetical protein
MCLHETSQVDYSVFKATYSKIRIGKHLSERFPIPNDLKQRDALSPLFFNFALEYTIRPV